MVKMIFLIVVLANLSLVKNVVENFTNQINYKINISFEKRRLGDPAYILANNHKIKKIKTIF